MHPLTVRSGTTCEVTQARHVANVQDFHAFSNQEEWLDRLRFEKGSSRIQKVRTRKVEFSVLPTWWISRVEGAQS